MKKLLLTVAAAALSSGLAFADHHQKGEKIDPAKANYKITITGNDQMQYDKKEFAVVSGKSVALTFKNIGKLPVIGMGHNVVILKKGADVVKVAMDAAPNRPKFLPVKPEFQKQILANTQILGPGESETITFIAPAPGEYDYICTFPGHFGVMRGKMKVTAK